MGAAGGSVGITGGPTDPFNVTVHHTGERPKMQDKTMTDGTLTDDSVGLHVAGLDIDGICQLLFACHFQCYEDTKKCVSNCSDYQK